LLDRTGRGLSASLASACDLFGILELNDTECTEFAENTESAVSGLLAFVRCEASPSFFLELLFPKQLLVREVRMPESDALSGLPVLSSKRFL
jgi:hypothetical protein